jgi:hypothetical protein
MMSVCYLSVETGSSGVAKNTMQSSEAASTSQYPSKVEVEECLKQLAVEIGDNTVHPFRVDLVPLHGGKPPMYAVVILSAGKEPLRQKLSQILTRGFSLGVSSFMLTGNEALTLLKRYRPQ